MDNVRWFEREHLERFMRSGVILPAPHVLDIGPGIRPQNLVQAKSPLHHICCEPYHEYAANLESRGHVVHRGTASSLMPKVAPGAYDAIFLLDVIEHMTKADGLDVLRHCVRVARKQVVIFTPLGFVEQWYELGEQDAWGMNGGEWQRHLSGWEPSEFPEPWKVYACQEFHTVNGRGEAQPAGAFWAILTKE